MSEQLSDHFSLDEFTFSETAVRMGREIVPPEDVLQNLGALCRALLEPVRVKLGKPMIVTSGYRPAWLNMAIGGSLTSAHMYGRAADLLVPGMSPLELCQWIQENADAEAWPIDQCIYEGRWTHLAIATDVPRHQYLTAHFSPQGISYAQGIV